MKPVLLFLVTLLSMYGLAQTSSVSLKNGKEVSEDINSFVYSLPYQKGKSYLLVQAYQSKLFSHKGEYALDFKMKKGAKICAARSGVVVEVKEDSKKAERNLNIYPKETTSS
jgi:hypothetical protein